MNYQDDINQARKKATAVLKDADGNATPQYQAYMKCQQEYEAKVKQKNDAYAEAVTAPMKLRNWPIMGKQLNDEVNNAMNKWIALGSKNEIENALGLLNSQSPNK